MLAWRSYAADAAKRSQLFADTVSIVMAMDSVTQPDKRFKPEILEKALRDRGLEPADTRAQRERQLVDKMREAGPRSDGPLPHWERKTTYYIQDSPDDPHYKKMVCGCLVVLLAQLADERV